MQILINIDVDDLERAIGFYEGALPLRLSRRLFDGSVAEMLGGSSRIYLIEQQAESPSSDGGQLRDFRRHWTPVHPDFVVDDVEVACERAVAAGAHRETPVRSFSWGRLVTLADPFGNGFCLVEFCGEPYGA